MGNQQCPKRFFDFDVSKYIDLPDGLICVTETQNNSNEGNLVVSFECTEADITRARNKYTSVVKETEIKKKEEDLTRQTMIAETNGKVPKYSNEICDMIPNVLDIGESCGTTGYLDFVEPKDVTNSTMKGVDSSGRPFFIITGELEFNNGEKKLFAKLFFQRYVDDLSEWANCDIQSTFNLAPLIGTGKNNARLDADQILFLKNLVQNGVAEIEYPDEYTHTMCNVTVPSNIGLQQITCMVNYPVRATIKKIF